MLVVMISISAKTVFRICTEIAAHAVEQGLVKCRKQKGWYQLVYDEANVAEEAMRDQ